MAVTDAARIRFGGAVVLACGSILFALGAYLVLVVKGGPYPAWLPEVLRIALQDPPRPTREALFADAAGYSSLFLVAFGITVAVLGVQMLAQGRKNRTLLALALIFIAVFVAVGVWAALSSGNRFRQIGM